MTTILVAHRNSHIVSAIGDMVKAVLGEIHTISADILTATSWDQMMSIIQVNRTDLLLVDSDLINGGRLGKIDSICRRPVAKVVLAKESWVISTRKRASRRGLAAVLIMPFQRQELKLVLRQLFSDPEGPFQSRLG